MERSSLSVWLLCDSSWNSIRKTSQDPVCKLQVGGTQLVPWTCGEPWCKAMRSVNRFLSILLSGGHENWYYLVRLFHIIQNLENFEYFFSWTFLLVEPIMNYNNYSESQLKHWHISSKKCLNAFTKNKIGICKIFHRILKYIPTRNFLQIVYEIYSRISINSYLINSTNWFEIPSKESVIISTVVTQIISDSFLVIISENVC